MSKYAKKPITDFTEASPVRSDTNPDLPMLCDGKVINGSTSSRSGAGALSVDAAIVEITTTGADALTLADGTEGQILYVVMIADGGDGTLTPSNFGAGTTITFADVGDACTLLFTNGNWYVVGENGVAIA